MQIPSDAFIETGADELKKVPLPQLADQLRELMQVSNWTIALSAARVSAPPGFGVNPPWMEMAAGYLLGLQTARVILATHPLIGAKGINPDDLL